MERRRLATSRTLGPDPLVNIEVDPDQQREAQIVDQATNRYARDVWKQAVVRSHAEHERQPKRGAKTDGFDVAVAGGEQGIYDKKEQASLLCLESEDPLPQRPHPEVARARQRLLKELVRASPVSSLGAPVQQAGVVVRGPCQLGTATTVAAEAERILEMARRRAMVAHGGCKQTKKPVCGHAFVDNGAARGLEHRVNTAGRDLILAAHRQHCEAGVAGSQYRAGGR